MIASTPYRYKGDAGGYWVVSSPNATWIPEIKWGVQEVYQRADGRFAWEDRTLWPQMYAHRFEYICCIPRQPEDPADPLSVLWWTPRAADFIAIRGSDVEMPLGQLPPQIVQQFEFWRDTLVAECRTYQREHDRSPLLGLLETSLRHAFIRITVIPLTQREMTANVAEFQRFCLDVHALLDYILIYQPRFSASDEETDAIPVSHHLMGAITHEDAIVMQLHKMKIPVWHVRPSLKIPSCINIRYSTNFRLPRNMVERHYPGEPYPSICKQDAGTLRLQATQRLGCVFLHLFDNVSAVAPDQSAGNENHKQNKASRLAPCMLMPIIFSYIVCSYAIISSTASFLNGCTYWYVA